MSQRRGYATLSAQEQGSGGGMGPVTRTGEDATAATVAAWILWVLIWLIGIVAMVFAILAWTRAGAILTDDSAILTLLTALETTIDSIYSLVSSTLVVSELLLSYQCTPIYSVPYLVPGPGCYFFIQELECDIPDGDQCILITETSDVEIDQRNFALIVDGPGSIGYGVYLAQNVKIRNGQVYTLSPSNVSTSRGIDALYADNLVVEGLRFSNFFRPIAHLYANTFTVTSSVFEFANQQNFAGFGNRVIGMVGVNDVAITGCTFLDNNVAGDTIGITYGVAWIAGDGAPCDGFRMKDCTFTDSHLIMYSGGVVDGNTDVQIIDTTFSVSDPLFAVSCFQIGDYTNDTANQQPTAVEIRGVTCTNLDPHTGFDGIYVVGARALRLTGNTVTMPANGFVPEFGVVNTAMIHLGIANDAPDVASSDLLLLDGVYAADNTLIGALGPADETNKRAGAGFRVEGARDVTLEDNKISGIAAGMPASPMSNWCIDPDHNDDCDSIGQCTQGQYPAQQQAGIWVSAGCVGVRVINNKLWDGACATGNWTIAASGIVIATNESRISYCPSGYGPVYFPPADNCLVEGNSVIDFCNKGIENLGGPGSRVWFNKAFGNGAGITDNYLDGPDAHPTVTQEDQDSPLVGWNLEGPCVFC